jgi:hypothetical protein
VQQGTLPFTPEENKHFQECQDANELVVAFDLLCWKFGEAEQISEDVYQLIATTGSMMDLPSQWTELKALVRDAE